MLAHDYFTAIENYWNFFGRYLNYQPIFIVAKLKNIFLSKYKQIFIYSHGFSNLSATASRSRSKLRDLYRTAYQK